MLSLLRVCAQHITAGDAYAPISPMAAQHLTGGYLLRGPFKPVWERTQAPGMVLGSIGAFLVLEARDHAYARGAKPPFKLKLPNS